MTTGTTKPGSRFVRWFKQVKDKNRMPYRWYEAENRGMG